MKYPLVGLAALFMALGSSSSAMATHGHSHDHTLCEGFVEKNDMRIPVPAPGQKKLNAMNTEAEFNSAIDKVTNVYNSIFSQKGQRLRVKKLWQDAQVNAIAYKEGSYSVVEIWGGLARHSVMTPDGVTLVMCHEVGHHLGGAPKYSESGGNWASVEGQADYFATLKCLRKVFGPEVATWNGEVDSTARSRCERIYAAGSDGAKLCGRIAMASMASARLTASLSGSGSPSFATKDPSVVTRTYEKHPASQCRLDTYLNGGFCQIAHTIDVSDSNLDAGVCRNIEAEEYGARSRCWFKPANSTTPPPTTPAPQPGPGPGPTPNPTPTPDPGSSIARTPKLNGVEVLVVRNPNQMLTFSWDVTNIPGAAGVYFEVIGPNRDFSNPNGVTPDRNAMPGGSIPSVRGSLSVLPARQLPGWGVYKFRVIPLDRTGRIPKGRYSNPASLNLTP